jgi:hypothetical protein
MRRAAALLGATFLATLLACGGDDADPAAFCDRFEALNARPDIEGDANPELSAALRDVARSAPGDARGALETVADFNDAVIAAGDDQDAQFELFGEFADRLDEATTTLEQAAEDCGFELDSGTSGSTDDTSDAGTDDESTTTTEG